MINKESIIKIIVSSKMYIQRSMSWMSIANSGMLLYLVFGQVRNYYGWNFNITYIFPIMFLGTIIGLLVFGYIEDRSGVHRAEQQITYTRNPQMNDVLARLDRIEKKVEAKNGV